VATYTDSADHGNTRAAATARRQASPASTSSSTRWSNASATGLCSRRT